MFIIGITPGVYTIARAAGAEAAREFAGIVEKISYGYTVGCNFFQIDQEAFGEYLEPNLLDKLSNLIEKMNIEWALHGFTVEAYYETFDYMPIIRWKLAHLILHRDLQYLYEFLLKAKFINKSPKNFPHYIVYHASAENIVGYGPLRGIVEEAALANPLGELSWIEILEDENRKFLKKWFVENLLPIIYSRIRIVGIRSYFEEFLEIFSLNFNNYLNKFENDEKNFKESLKKIVKLFLEGFLNSEKISEIEKNIEEKNFDELRRIVEDVTIRGAFYNLLKFFREILKEDFEEWKEWFRKNWKEIKRRIKKDEEYKKIFEKVTLDIYEEWKELSQRIATGYIPYEDAIVCLISKDIEFSAKYENYKGLIEKILKSKKVEVFLFEEYIKKVEKEEKEEIKESDLEDYSDFVENHVSKFYDNQKELIDFYKSEINLTPSLNTLTAIVYWILHFLVDPPIELKNEVLKRLNSFANKDYKEKVLEFSKKNAFEKLKEIIKELRDWNVKRKTAFFIGIETPEGRSPEEGLRKICHLKDVFILTEALNIAFREYSKLDENAFEVVIDTEHLLSNAFDVEKEISRTVEFVKSGKVYSRIAVYHIGTPKPYGGTTHIPFDIGSDEQFLIYKYCYMLKDLGFKKDFESYLIFERGGGRFPYEFLRTVILALRKIVEYLEKGIDPKEIEKEPMKYIDFFGLSYDMFSRWKLIIQQYALEPLKGLIVLPEEEHTYLGKEAIEKYRKRPEEWKAEELK